MLASQFLEHRLFGLHRPQWLRFVHPMDGARQVLPMGIELCTGFSAKKGILSA